MSSSSKFDFFGSSSSFSSTLGLGRKVRDVQSSMLKFDELFELVQATFWDRFGEKIIQFMMAKKITNVPHVHWCQMSLKSGGAE